MTPTPARGQSTPSFWLDQTGARPTRRALQGTTDADVCIVGGGFTGLWTAYELRRADPSLSVVVLEAEHVGFGASGRNGGWVLGKLSGSAAAWRRRGGPDAPRAMERAINATVGEIAAAISREGIECDWQQGGSLTVAQNERQLARLHAELADEQAWAGEDCGWQFLDGQALAARVAIRDGRGALYTPYCARVQPAKLVAGLAAAAERAGATIYERSRVAELAPGCARTAGGEVRARSVLLATEGYTANLPGRHRSLLPLNSAMIVTEPLGDEVWSQLGWSGAETLLDGSYVYTYSQRTAEGRIAIGGRGVPYRYGSRTDREGPVPAQTVQELSERLRGLFAPLRDVLRSPGRGTACSASRATGARRSALTPPAASASPAATPARASRPPTWPRAPCATSCSAATPSSPACPGSAQVPATGSPSRFASSARAGSTACIGWPTAARRPRAAASGSPGRPI